MKVLVTEEIHEGGLKYLESKGITVLRRFGISYEELLKEVPHVDALSIRSFLPIDRQVFEKGVNLKVIGMNGIGLNHIDMAAAKEKGIPVINCPDGSLDSVAELAVGLMLSVARNIVSSCEHVKEGGWKKTPYMGTQLRGKTLGIIALGKIGLRVAKICQAMGMEVIAFDPYCTESFAKENNVKLVSLEELVSTADVISIHAPLTPETKGLLGKKEIDKMKKGVIIVNAGRGGIICEEAAYEGLKSGKIGGMGLDVLAVEPPQKVTPLLEFSTVVVTPHLGATTREAQELISKIIAEKVAEVLLAKA